LTSDHVESIVKLISDYEEEYGIISKKVNEYKLERKKSTITLTPENIDKLSGVLKHLQKSEK